MRSRAVTSMSRNCWTSALVPSGPWPGTILVLLSVIENFVVGRDHAVDLSARASIDIGIKPVEANVARLQDICFGKMNHDVGVRVRGSDVHHGNAFAVERESVRVGERLLR